MTEDNKCDLCKGVGNFNNVECAYCNGTGEWNQAAQSYMQSHICQCILWDRKFCPVCKQKCHHDTSLSPKQVIDPGFGGLGASTEAVGDIDKREVIII